MTKRIITFILGLTASLSFAQSLTPDQRDSDFRYLASLYTTYYSGYDWKKQLFNVDARNLTPWLDRVKDATNDLDFYELCVEYVASLNDTHDAFSLPSDFLATLNFATDIYDGVLLIDSLNRTRLPVATYPFVFGDELVSVDGVPVEKLVQDFTKYAPQGNPQASKRIAAQRITIRPQSRMPHAPDVGDSASVVIRRQSGVLETYSIPWTKTGTPIKVGPVPSPKLRTRPVAPALSLASNQPDYMAALEGARFSGVTQSEDLGLLNYGSRTPIFINAMPGLNFTRRLGGAGTDFFYSGTFQSGDLTIGYIRIPNYAPPSTALALAQFEGELAYMSTKADGLIVDEMRNTGGNLCFGQEIVRRLVPYQFQATGFALRPYYTRMLGFYNSMISAKAQGASQEVIQLYEQSYQEMLSANQQGRLVTKPLPLCSASLTRDPATDLAGNMIAYQKPIIMLIDEFSTSTADSVPSMFQDAQRGLVIGMRSNGAGGNNTSFDAGPYTEGFTGMTLALQVRSSFVTTPEYPTSLLIENVGVRPDVESNYMTKENLLQGGVPFLSTTLNQMAYVIKNPTATAGKPLQ